MEIFVYVDLFFFFCHFTVIFLADAALRCNRILSLLKRPRGRPRWLLQHQTCDLLVRLMGPFNRTCSVCDRSPWIQGAFFKEEDIFSVSCSILSPILEGMSVCSRFNCDFSPPWKKDATRTCSFWGFMSACHFILAGHITSSVSQSVPDMFPSNCVIRTMYGCSYLCCTSQTLSRNTHLLPLWGCKL